MGFPRLSEWFSDKMTDFQRLFAWTELHKGVQHWASPGNYVGVCNWLFSLSRLLSLLSFPAWKILLSQQPRKPRSVPLPMGQRSPFTECYLVVHFMFTSWFDHDISIFFSVAYCEVLPFNQVVSWVYCDLWLFCDFLFDANPVFDHCLPNNFDFECVMCRNLYYYLYK